MACSSVYWFIPATLTSTRGPPTDENSHLAGNEVIVELKMNGLDLEYPGTSPG